MVSLMQNEGKTGKRKTMFMSSSDDFSAPSESLEYVKLNNEKFSSYVFIFLAFSSIHYIIHYHYTHTS